MSTVSATQKQRLLVDEERLLRAQLLEVLPAAIEQGSDLFTNHRFNPFGFSAARIGASAHALLEAAETCISLREGLQLQVAGSVGQLFLSACEERASLASHGLGPRRLAERLLSSLRSSA